MAYYVKVTKQVADKMGLTSIRNMTLFSFVCSFFIPHFCK